MLKHYSYAPELVRALWIQPSLVSTQISTEFILTCSLVRWSFGHVTTIGDSSKIECVRQCWTRIFSSSPSIMVAFSFRSSIAITLYSHVRHCLIVSQTQGFHLLFTLRSLSVPALVHMSGQWTWSNISHSQPTNTRPSPTN